MHNNELLTLDADQISTMYHHSFSKKEAVKTGQELVNKVFENGELEPLAVFSNICRLKEVINSADKEFRDRLHITDVNSVNGVSFKQNNGSQKLNLSEDPIYAELAEKLAARGELIKVATKSKDVIFDNDGIEVPKVSITFTKPSITVTF